MPPRFQRIEKDVFAESPTILNKCRPADTEKENLEPQKRKLNPYGDPELEQPQRFIKSEDQMRSPLSRRPLAFELRRTLSSKTRSGLSAPLPPRFNREQKAVKSHKFMPGSIAARIRLRRAMVLRSQALTDTGEQAPMLSSQKLSKALHTDPHPAVAIKIGDKYLYLLDLAGVQPSRTASHSRNFWVRAQSSL